MIKLVELTHLLNNNFLNNYNTIIVDGFDEPFYQTFKNNKPAEIQFTKDYIRSALHELSHWCVAGVERRKIDDYGYWYAEDGRNQQQQDEFFKVEVIPQTFEWAFSQACGVTFEASVDNLHNSVNGIEKFEQNLSIQMHNYQQKGFPMRVGKILNLLSNLKH